MPMFMEESEDSLIRNEELREAQLKTGFGTRRFGAWALMKSSMSAEQREMKAVERKRRSLEREKRRLSKIRQLRAVTKKMFTWEHYEPR